jgi:hypothetical protein
MGKASSSKKVARAARAGGATKGRSSRWIFPAAIFAIFVVGVSVVIVAKGGNETASAASPKVGEHWHAAYGVYVCDKFLDPMADTAPDKLGIHTHGDGIMHVHPFSGVGAGGNATFSGGAAGSNATFSVFGEATGLTFQSNGFTTADGTQYHNGYDCNGVPAEVAVYQWSASDLTAAPIIHTKDFGSIRYTEDRLVFTLAVVPPGTDVPPPPSVPTLDKLTDVAGATTATSTAGATASSVVTVPSAPAAPTGASSTTSTAAPAK